LTLAFLPALYAIWFRVSDTDVAGSSPSHLTQAFRHVVAATPTEFRSSL
jgi:hypothetical protein